MEIFFYYKLTINGEIHDLTEARPDAIHSLAQIEALMILLHPAEHQWTIRVYP